MNITDPIQRHAQLAPDAVAVIQAGNAVTYRQLNQVIDALAARLSGLGLRPGDTAGVLVTSRYGHLALILALARLGAAAAIARDVARGLGGVALKASFVDAATAGDASAGAITVDNSWWHSPAGAEEVPPVASHPDGRAICLIVSSSGTTGLPKAVALSHDTLRTRLHDKWLAVRAPDGARQLCLLGLESYYGFSSNLRALWTGGRVAMGIKANEMHLAIELHRLNCLVMSPAQLHALLGALPAAAGPFASLELIEIGGSALSPRLAARARARLCANLYTAYGAAEAGNVASAPAALLDRHSGAAGYITPGIEVQAVDGEDRPLAPGAEGAIRIRGESCVAAYLGDPDASARSFRDGWFYPGDVGSVAADGLLSISGRSNEIINAGGVKVSPQVIEDVVLMNQDVSEAAAFAVQKPSGMQEIWVAIVQHKPVDTEALRAFCAQKLGPKAPKSILLLKELPRNENGKVLRDQLVRLAGSAKKKGAG
jgi:acyl-CoA synthetase (AMP-forming)/AMP-acid ligase II